MAAGRKRSTRKLRAWIVEQVCSGKYPGLVWDDEAKTMFRIPWKHAGKQDFRKDEDAAIFKAWADFKGKLNDGGGDSPASWKTRLRCALNKSTEFQEVAERAQLDISEPYKVYRLVPPAEQGSVSPEKKCKAKAPKRQKSRRRRTSHLDTDDSDEYEEHGSHRKVIKTEQQISSQPEDQNFPQNAEESTASSDSSAKPEDFQYTIEFTTDDQTDTFPDSPLYRLHPTAAVDEITLDVRIEENVPTPTEAQDSFHVAIHYLGHEVLQRHVLGTDMRILYPSSSPAAPVPTALGGSSGFPRILLPEPPASLPPSEEQRALSTLLPFMERGVALTSTDKGIYGRRFCQGRVFWTGPHTTTPGLHKMERNTEPVLLFSKDIFKQQLENFNANGGDPPQCSITLCFGEELSTTDDLASKLVIVQVTLPWAEQQLQKVLSIQDSISLLRSLASQSPLGEITLNLVTLPPLTTDDTDLCGSA